MKLSRFRDRRMAALKLGTLVLVVIVGLSASAKFSVAAEKVTLGFPHTVGITSTTMHLVLSKELGYYAAEGLDVEFLYFNGSSITAPQVATKKVDIAWGGASLLIKARQKGRDYLPIKFFYNWLRSSVWEFAVLADGPIRSLQDLKGKKLGISNRGAGNIPQTMAALRSAGLEPGTDVGLVPVGYGAPAFRALTTGAVQALNLFEGMHVILETRGTKLRRLAYDEKFSEMFSDGFYTHDDTIKNRGAMLAKFGRAVTKGIIACEANREACTRAMWKHIPIRKPVKGPEAKHLANSAKVSKARYERILAFEPGTPRKFGEYPAGSWRQFVDVLYAEGELNTRDIPIDTLFTNEFVADFNKFDAVAVRRQARAAN